MMASLYQSGSASGAPAPGLAAVRGERLEGLTSLILPGPPRSSWAPLSGNPEDVGYRGGRIELDIVTTPSPCVGGTVQEVVDLKRLVRPKPQHVQREVRPPGLRVVWVQIDHHEDHVAAIRRVLAVADEVIIVDPVEVQCPVAV